MKIFLALIFLFSFNSYSKEKYLRQKGQCLLKVISHDMYNQSKELPFKMNISYLAAFNYKREQLLGSKVQFEPEIEATTIDIFPMLSKLNNEAKLQFLNGSLNLVTTFDKNQLSDLILYSGSYRGKLNGIFKEDGLTISTPVSCGVTNVLANSPIYDDSFSEFRINIQCYNECFNNSSNETIDVYDLE
ncbi:MAG: hypothetical protein L6Q33_03315 [Bacteriovoracaceae bacterium]|nr:hypothetical protein [Bacteriovoracaceae bacterium]